MANLVKLQSSLSEVNGYVFFFFFFFVCVNSIFLCLESELVI